LISVINIVRSIPYFYIVIHMRTIQNTWWLHRVSKAYQHVTCCLGLPLSVTYTVHSELQCNRELFNYTSKSYLYELITTDRSPQLWCLIWLSYIKWYFEFPRGQCSGISLEACINVSNILEKKTGIDHVTMTLTSRIHHVLRSLFLWISWKRVRTLPGNKAICYLNSSKQRSKSNN